MFNGNYVSTLCGNMVRFGPVTPEFKRVKGVHPFVDQQFSYVRLAASLLGTATSVLSFVGRPVLSLVLTLSFVLRICCEASLLRREGYTLGSATHF